MEAEDGYCNTRLGLGLGYGEYVPRPKIQKNKAMVCLDLSFTLCPKEEAMTSSIQHVDDNKEERSCFKSSSVIEDGEEYSNKRGRHAIDTNKDGTGTGKKKLRLTKEQSALLEESFKLHTTLNPAQKQALAEQLNLKQRQVEVWFQNRRARTKLKQTEVDCEFLRKCCENLSDENRRLKKELQELRSGRIGRSSPFHFSKDARITMCPSCEKRTTAGQKNAASFDVVQAS